jgi:thiamine-monophosphate kinase
MANERELIERLARVIPSFQRGNGAKTGVVLGIGDDAAIVRSAAGGDSIITVDAFVEGVHFLRRSHPPDSIGYKALARAASDIVAMGARPRFFLLSLGLPSDCTGAWLNQFAKGMGRAARSLGLVLIGGDTTRNPSIAISITVMGDTPRSGKKTRATMRSGARPGDVLYVSGRLGRAQLGLQIVLRGRGRDRKLRKLLGPHLYPAIRVALGQWLASRGVASAMMDLSDGLSADLPRLCSASGVGARIYAEKIPCVEIPPPVAKQLGARRTDPLDLALRMALHGGDDYELLFAVPRKLERKLAAAPDFQDLKAIGEIERSRGVRLVDRDGRVRPMPAQGWDSFREA